MSWFMPTIAVRKLIDIPISLLHEMGVEAVFLDVDNTIALHGSMTPFDGTVEWTHKVREAGIKMVILSNNLKKRVGPLAEKFDLPYICFSQKPFPLGLPYAKKLLGIDPKKIVLIGDQIFTDILGANWHGMQSILLVPAQEEGGLSFRFRRSIEKPVRRKIKFWEPGDPVGKD